MTATRTDRPRRPTPARLAIAGAVAVVLVLLVSSADRALGGGGSAHGDASSSYTTGPDGLAGYADLLAARGHPIERVRRALAATDLRPTDTLVVAGDGTLEPGDRAVVRAFVEAGGRLVLLGPSPGRDLADLADPAGPPLRWSSIGLRIAAPTGTAAAETARVARVEGSGTGSWTVTGAYTPLLGDDGHGLVVAAGLGAGRVVAVADEAILQDRLLAQADNAALGVDLAGPSGRRIRFAEERHGFTDGAGLSAIPGDWRWFLAGALVAAVAARWSGGLRLGPPQQVGRTLAPARSELVHALGRTLARTRDLTAVAARVRRAAREQLAWQAGLGPDPSDAQLEAAGAALGLTAADLRSLVHDGGAGRPDRPAPDAAAEALAVGAVLAQLERGRT